MFSYIDLFAGIGGFHAALSAAGGECVFASEIDQEAVATYARNWKMDVAGDITALTEPEMKVPYSDLVAGGFPCQPFSKSGQQRGMEETRGTLFFNIEQIIIEHKPAVILLENVRNLAGPRHAHEWKVIVDHLREEGYRVSSKPAIFSPHLLPPSLGGRPQVRERVFITGTYVGPERAMAETDVEPLVTPIAVDGWNPQDWDLYEYLETGKIDAKYNLSDAENRWVDVWNALVVRHRELTAKKLPGFPLWADAWVTKRKMYLDHGGKEAFEAIPAWKKDFLMKNSAFYEDHKELIDQWRKDFPDFADFPASRRKLEWQAQEAESLNETIMHFRPSGIRAKRPTYVPALVAITQTTILGKERRRITPREAARLQAFPEWFEFGDRDAAAYKQLGNAVNVNVVYWILRQHVLRDKTDLKEIAPDLVDAVLSSPNNPDEALGNLLRPV